MFRLVRPKLAVNDEDTVAPAESAVAVSMTDLLSKLTYRYSPLIVQLLATAYSMPGAPSRSETASRRSPKFDQVWIRPAIDLVSKGFERIYGKRLKQRRWMLELMYVLHLC